MAGLLPVFVQPETEEDDIDEEGEDDAVEQSVVRQEAENALRSEGGQYVHDQAGYDGQHKADPRRVGDGAEAERLDEFILLFLFGQADEQGGQRCRHIQGQSPELTVFLRDKFKSVEQPKLQGEHDGARNQQRPADPLEGVGEKRRSLSHGVRDYSSIRLSLR